MNDPSGYIVRGDDLPPRTGLRGHPGCTAYRMLRPPEHLSRWLHVTYDVFECGGGIDPHHHEGIDADHAYYVIEGEVRVRVGDTADVARSGDLIVFPCDVVHGFVVQSPDGARVLRLGAAPDGRTSGGSIFVEETDHP